MIRPLFIALVGLVGLMTSGGCGATIIPPQSRLSDPAPVFVTDYGIHSSLLLPTPDGRFVEYAFGDWGYAAQNKTMPQDAVGALLVSFQGALGRRYYELPPGEAEPHPADRPSRISKFYCERSDAYDLVRRLDERYAAALRTQTPLRNPENGLEFVKDPEHYSIANNCNHMTARSLEQLGCRVKGVVVNSSFHLDEAASRPALPPRPELPGWSTASIE